MFEQEEEVNPATCTAVATMNNDKENNRKIIQAGDRVTLHGLVSAAKLNGRSGTCEGTDPTAGRLIVRLLLDCTTTKSKQQQSQY